MILLNPTYENLVRMQSALIRDQQKTGLFEVGKKYKVNIAYPDYVIFECVKIENNIVTFNCENDVIVREIQKKGNYDLVDFYGTRIEARWSEI